jgi:mono/diheme cytochrome c family protein
MKTLFRYTFVIAGVCFAQAASPDPKAWRRMVEADWLAFEDSLAATNVPAAALRTAEDAGGGCDGVKNGLWGFHTGQTNQPWWQVDLGERQPLARVRIWNRCDAADRASRLQVLVSDDARQWQTVYQHGGTVFYGATDGKPLEIKLDNTAARFLRIQLPGAGWLHLDEVEVFGPSDPAKNLALRRPADQISLSAWSRDHRPVPEIDWAVRTGQTLAFCERLLRELREAGRAELDPECSQKLAALKGLPAAQRTQATYLAARWLQRKLALANPALDFDAILITKRIPGSFNHMSDQYYGWWSRPGGGIYRLRNFKGDAPQVECLTAAFKEPGSFLRPALSYDASKVLFAWCKYYPKLAAEPDKLNKANVPEDAFFHLFEMNLDGSGARQLTRGKYDDFDGRYLPDGRIVFCSTRRGQFIQVDRDSAGQTVAQADLPDCYVRCGGGPERPVAVYTLHVMQADGSGVCAISPFEMFEWEPSVAGDGSVLYARWDYIDRDNMPFMSLWATHPDGTGTRLVYKNYTRSPHCVFEPRSIPHSGKIIFTASGHHSQTMGSLVLLDPAAGTEGKDPITRLTPEVCFPEIEGWPKSYYANPWPLSERFYLTSWGNPGAKHPGPAGWDRWHSIAEIPIKDMGICWFDAAGQLELLYRDPDISCLYPLPVRPQARPPAIADQVSTEVAKEGRFFITDINQGFSPASRGSIAQLRLVAVPPKTHPTMNFPNLGITADDPGKCVLGTVPVEVDGSAYFRAPSGVTLFFQALDERGLAVQTMRSATYVQPGQTVSCIGCHEPRTQAAPVKPALAALREPSKILPGPAGSWPYRFDQLVQPVLDRHCVSCHSPGAKDAHAAKLDLTAVKAYDSLVRFGKPSLYEQVWAGYRQGASTPGDGLARRSALWALLSHGKGHYDVKLDAEARERLIVWMDTYAQKLGAFSPDQERQLQELRRACAGLLAERRPAQMTTAALR